MYFSSFDLLLKFILLQNVENNRLPSIPEKKVLRRIAVRLSLKEWEKCFAGAYKVEYTQKRVFLGSPGMVICCVFFSPLELENWSSI